VPELYTVNGELPELDRPVLVQAMSGFVDAGGATRLACESMLDSPGARELAVFDIDQLLDYRSRRPPMIFVEDHWESYEEPRLALHLLNDDEGTPYLLLAGPEPDLLWERFIAAVVELVDRLGVRVTVGLNAIPMGVPHTRPTGVTAHATRPDLILGYESMFRRIQVPGSAGNLLEYRLGQRGRDAIGFAVHVPHYLAQTAYPTAAEELLASVSRATGLLLPTARLRQDGDVIRGEIDQQVALSEEATAMVRALELQYDTLLRAREGTNLLAEEGAPLPSADELGAELERFLAEHSRRNDPPKT